MSFQNDDERDGLASLFGGITPQAGEPGRRRAAPGDPDATPTPTPSRATPESPVSDAPAYPGLEPSIPFSPPPADPPPPAFTPEPPTFGSPGGAQPAFPPPAFPPPAYTPPAYSPPAYTPPAYAAPAEPPVAPPTGAFGEPATADPRPAEGGRYAAPSGDAHQPYAAPQPYVPPAYLPPTDVPPTYVPPTYDLPAPAAAPAPGTPVYSSPPTEPPPVAPPAPALHYPGSDPATLAHPSAAHYPPTAQYPTGVDSSTPYSDVQPAAEPQAAAPPHPLSEPQAPSESPPIGGFAALGLEPVDLEPPVAEPSVPRPEVDADTGYARSTPSSAQAGPGTVEPAALRGGPTPVLRRPPGPLLPTDRPVVVAPEDLSRATTFEKIGLALAVIGGPLGLVLAVVNGVRGVRRRGWLTRLGRVSIVLAVISTIAAGIGGVTLWNIRETQLARDQVAAASAEFCAAAAENPQTVELPLLGWPDPGATITESLTLMEAWTTRWTDLAAVSPAGLRTGLDLLASRGGEVIEGVQQSRLVNDAENERVISATASSSGVANWYETYCVAP